MTLRLVSRIAPVGVANTSATAPAGQDRGRILLVEDDERVADLVARSLVKAGYSVTIKNDVASAWQQLQLDVPDLLVTDIVMPDGRGTELVRRLRALELNLPILFISGYPEEASGEWRQAAGQVQFLAKPFRTADLLQRVGMLMAGSRTTA